MTLASALLFFADLQTILQDYGLVCKAFFAFNASLG